MFNAKNGQLDIIIDEISMLHNDFETTLDAGYAVHKAVGFQEIGMEGEQIQLENNSRGIPFEV